MIFTKSIEAHQYFEGQECPGVSFGFITTKFNHREKVEDGDYVIAEANGYFSSHKAEDLKKMYVK